MRRQRRRPNAPERPLPHCRSSATVGPRSLPRHWRVLQNKLAALKLSPKLKCGGLMRTVSKATLLAGSASTALLVAGPWPNDAQAQEVAVGGGSTRGMFSWTGVYIGVHGGGIWSDEDNDDDSGGLRSFHQFRRGRGHADPARPIASSTASRRRTKCRRVTLPLLRA